MQPVTPSQAGSNRTVTAATKGTISIQRPRRRNLNGSIARGDIAIVGGAIDAELWEGAEAPMEEVFTADAALPVAALLLIRSNVIRCKTTDRGINFEADADDGDRIEATVLY